MRITDDARKSVVFFGYPDAGSDTGIVCVGTGFLLSYQGDGYLITAKHLSHQLGLDPFLLRVNKRDGTAVNLHCDGLSWVDHPDPSVDAALVQMHFYRGSIYDCVYLHEGMLLTPDRMKQEYIGVGSLTYTVGLFRLLSGRQRNLPMCHFGAISMLPGDERIPIVDWNDPERGRRLFVEGYLVQSPTLDGLSGSPVFVRPETGLTLQLADEGGNVTRAATIAGPRAQILLLGIWQGAWNAPPDEVRAAHAGRVVVPVGTGIVVPCERIIELLNVPEVKAMREATVAAREMPAAEPQSVPMARERSADDSEWHEPHEAAQRRDETLRRMLSTPPQPKRQKE